MVNSCAKSFNNGIIFNRIAFYCIRKTISRQYTQLFYKPFTGATEYGRSMGGCNFGKSLPINVKNCHRGKSFVFSHKKLSDSSEFHYLEPDIYLLITDTVEATNTLTQERHNHIENYITVKLPWRPQKLSFTLQIKDLVLHSLVRTWGIFLAKTLAMVLERCDVERKELHKLKFAYDIVRIHFLMIYTDLIK